MHHMYPGLAKGDPLCPLGFHPQVRWPTRCKRCFRDYKEHGGRKKEDDIAASTPTLSTWNSPSSRGRDEENGAVGEKVGRSWASSSNLSTVEPSKKDVFSTGLSNTKTSWTSTPDLAANENDSTNEITVSLKLPKRRSTGPLPSLDTGQNASQTETVTVRRQSPAPTVSTTTASIVINKNDSLAERVRKMQLIKAQNSFEKESSVDKERERRSTSRSKDDDKPRRSASRGSEDEKPSKTQEEKSKTKEEKTSKPKDDKASIKDDRSTKEDVNFLIQIKNNRNSSYTKPPIRGGPTRDEKEVSDDEASTTGTTTDTDTTLVDNNVKEYQEQIESLKEELDILKKRCERVEKEKSDILLRRLANIDTSSKYSTGRSSEMLKLQQKVNELTSQNEDLKDEKIHLSLKIREMEAEVESRPSAEAQTRQIEQLRAKLLAAETLCEELMDENEDMKKELRDLEEEIEEMQDNFREDQADEYSSLRRELEQTIKNCRVLSFKLKKSERKADQLEQEKADQEKKLLEIVGGAEGLQRENRIKELEKEVSRTNEVAQRLQRDLAEANAKLAAITGTPNPSLKKPSETTNTKVSRASLTRGGSQEDPAQLLRDLQDSLEREADLREQLRNAEEEASRYLHRHGGKRIPPLTNYLSAHQHHPSSSPAANDFEKQSLKKILATQYDLERQLSSFNISDLNIGINKLAQSPQDHVSLYSEECQTDKILIHDVASDTRKITLDSCIQVLTESLEMYTQTEIVFRKNKNVQTDNNNINTYMQTEKAKLRNAYVQTTEKLLMSKSIETTTLSHTENTMEKVTAIKSEEKVLENNAMGTQESDLIHNGIVNLEDKQIETEYKKEIRQKSYSPPLSTEPKNSQTTDKLQFPFALFNPLAVRLPVANNLRKTASRVEDDNESLLLQLKKMATKARSRKLSPSPPSNRLAIEAPNEKDEGISDEEDPAELRILLELNEQEAAVLRKKVEDLEQDRDSLRKQVKELTDKFSNITTKTTSTPPTTFRRNVSKTNNLADEKVKVLEDEIAELRKKIIEKERECERLHTELSLAQKKPKASLIKSKSLDAANELQNVDLKRQLQVIEQEASVLRAKTQSLEADNEKLQAENKKLQLLKNVKTLKTDKSQELNANKISKLENELKEALEKIKNYENSKEKEEKTEKKVRFGTEANKKENDTLKLKQEELDKLKLNFEKLEKEKTKLQTTLKELKEDAIKSFKPRKPKIVTDLTTKLQMKKMVEDLESEIGELYVVMKNAQGDNNIKTINSKIAIDKELENLKLKLSKNETEFTNEKNRLQNEIGKLKVANAKLEADKMSISEKYKSMELESTNGLIENKKLKDENKNLESQISKLNAEIKKFSTQQTVVSDCMKKIEDLKKDMDVKDKEIEKLKKQVENVNKLEQDKSKLLKEVGDKVKKINELEKKLKEAEDKSKRIEKQLSLRKDRVTKLEKELSEEKEKVATLDNSRKRLSIDLTNEKDEIQASLCESDNKIMALEANIKQIEADYKNKITTLESTVAAKDTHIKQLEDALRETSNQKYDEAISSVELAQIKEKYEVASKELKEKEEELSTVKSQLSKMEKDLLNLQKEHSDMKSISSKFENEKKDLESKIQAEKKDATYWENKASDLDIDLQAERKKVDRMRINHDRDIKNKEAELATLKGKLKVLEQTTGAGAKRIAELKQEHEEKTKRLEHSLAVEKAEYEELTGKYEILEEEHVVTKARLTVEKEKAQAELLQVQQELNSALEDFKNLQNNYEAQSSGWNREKSELQEEISSLQERLCGGGWEVERSRMSARLEQTERDLKDTVAELDVLRDTHQHVKKEFDEARKKLDDYEKVTKIQRTLTADNEELERELSALNNRLEQTEKARRSEVSDIKSRYEGQMDTMREELKSLHNQVSRFRRERDNYKQMMEEAQKSLKDLRSGDKKPRHSISSTDEDEYRSKVAVLEQQMACLEDELCESRLLASKLNTELVSERSAAEVRLSEMQSRLNEYEEERLLNSGRSRVTGMATRMELAWHKERDELQRLVQETSTLARDLRQTLFEVEREREKERLDMKRRIDQLKRTTEEETEDAKKKVTELQCDLLELRDAHAKLRTANEKLRRDKERHDRDRDQHRLLVSSLKRSQQDDDNVITQLLETIDEMMSKTPELFPEEAPKPPEKRLMTPTPPRRNRSSKSRSRSGTPEGGAEGAGAAASTGARLRRLADELRASRIAERQRRHAANARRAMSTEPRDTLSVSTSRPAQRTSSLKKRSISLEQTTKDQSAIWKSVDDSSVSSMQSLDGDADMRLYTMQRDASLDSRLSGGSAQSDVLPSEKKKKKGLFGKLKKLTKSRSIDDHVDAEVDFRPIGTVQRGSDSDMSTTGSRRDLRGRLSDMFSRKGPMSRGNSKEQSPDRPASAAAGATSGAASGAGGGAASGASTTSSATRPILRNASTSALTRASPVKPTDSPSSRATSVTPGIKRKGK